MSKEDIRKKRKPSQRDLHAEENREKLLAAGYKLMCEYGIDGVGVREISEAVGVTTGTFYYYFKSKQDLLWKYANERKEFDAGFEGLPAGSVYERILAFFTGAVADVLEMDGYAVMMWILLQKQTSPQLYKAVYRLVCEGIETKEISDERTPEDLTEYILNCYRGAALAWYRAEGKTDVRNLIRDLVGHGLERYVIKI